MAKKVVIIGANSYIARNVYFVLKKYNQQMAAEGKQVYEIKRYGRAQQSPDDEAGYVQADICRDSDFAKFDLDCDVIFMFVGKTGAANGFDDYDTFIDVNERSLLNLIFLMRQQHSRAKLVFPSTRLVYRGKAEPQKEDASKEFKTIYAMNKWSCENYLRQYHTVFGIDYVIFRICLPYGTLVRGASSYGTAEFMLSKAMQGENITLYGDGRQRRTLTYIRDLVDILITGGMSDVCKNDVFNVGGEDYSLREMAELIAAKLGVQVVSIPWPQVALSIESGDTIFDASKLESVLGIQAQMHFADWVKRRGI